MDFEKVAYALHSVSNSAGSYAKLKLLKEYGESIEGFKEVLRFIYDPCFVTGLKESKLERGGITMSEISAEQIMDYLSTNNTGTDYDAAVANSFIYQNGDPVWYWAATGLVTKHLRIGVSLVSLNKVFGPDFIRKIGIMRGMLCPKDAVGDYIATEKIDGNRRLIFTYEDGPRAYTRSGKPDTGLVEILKEAEQLPVGYVFDCECIAMGEFENNIALRQATASILNRGKAATKTGVMALCFDMLPISEHNAGHSSFMALARKTMLAKVLGDIDSVVTLQTRYPMYTELLRALSKTFESCYLDHIKALPVIGFPETYDEAVEMAKPIWETGGEGLMLVDIKSAYEVNPNPRKTLLKIKATEDFACPCYGVYEGKGKYAGMMGGVIILYTASDGIEYTVEVGSGFTDYERQYYWEHPDEIIGTIIEGDCFGESTNAQGTKSLNCPIFKRITGNE